MRRGEPELPDYLKTMQQLAVRASRHGVEIDVTSNAERRRAVLAHSDLAARLCEDPLNYVRAEQWTGFIPPEMFNQTPNTSPRRLALVDIYEQAVARAAVPVREAVGHE